MCDEQPNSLPKKGRKQLNVFIIAVKIEWVKLTIAGVPHATRFYYYYYYYFYNECNGYCVSLAVVNMYAHVKCSNYSCINKTNAKYQIQTSPHGKWNCTKCTNEWTNEQTKKGTYKCSDETGETFGRTFSPFALIMYYYC